MPSSSSDADNNNNNNDDDEINISTAAASSSPTTDMIRQMCYGSAKRVKSIPVVEKLIPYPNNKGLNRVVIRGDEAMIRVHAAGLNPVDAKAVLGDKLPHSWTTLRRLVDTCVTAGHVVGFEFCGQIVQDIITSSTNNNNGDYKAGDWVYGTVPPYVGTLTEYILRVPLHHIQHKPTNLSPIEAAALPLVGLTCLQALKPYLMNSTTTIATTESQQQQQQQHRPLSSKSILVIGASGGTGHVACQIAKAMGCTTIVAICSGRNTDFVRNECGATHVLDYTTTTTTSSTTGTTSIGGTDDALVEAARDVLRSCNSHDDDDDDDDDRIPLQFDVVMDCVTSADPRDAAHEYPKRFVPLAKRRYIRLGGPSIDWIRAGIERGERGRYIKGFWGTEQLFWIRFHESSDELQQLKEWVESGQLQVKVAETIDFTTDAIQNAFDRIMDRRVQGKMVVQVIPDGDDDS